MFLFYLVPMWTKSEDVRRTAIIFKEYTGKVFIRNPQESLLAFSEISCVQKCIANDYCTHVNYYDNHLSSINESNELLSSNCELIDFEGEFKEHMLEERKEWKCITVRKVLNIYFNVYAPRPYCLNFSK